MHMWFDAQLDQKIWKDSSQDLTCSKCDLQSRPSTLTVTLSFGATLSTSIFQASESVVDAKISDGLAISKSDMALPSREDSV